MEMRGIRKFMRLVVVMVLLMVGLVMGQSFLIPPSFQNPVITTPPFQNPVITTPPFQNPVITTPPFQNPVIPPNDPKNPIQNPVVPPNDPNNPIPNPVIPSPNFQFSPPAFPTPSLPTPTPPSQDDCDTKCNEKCKGKIFGFKHLCKATCNSKCVIGLSDSSLYDCTLGCTKSTSLNSASAADGADNMKTHVNSCYNKCLKDSNN